MSKVKTVEFVKTEVEIDKEYPIYLYFQDEDYLDEFQKITESTIITVKSIHGGYKITVLRNYGGTVDKNYLERSECSKGDFIDAYHEACNWLNRLN